jgi:hypothetical protein
MANVVDKITSKMDSVRSRTDAASVCINRYSTAVPPPAVQHLIYGTVPLFPADDDVELVYPPPELSEAIL